MGGVLLPRLPGAQGPISSVLAGWNADLPAVKQDLDKAREELAQSKYADALDSHPVTLYWVTDVPDEEKLALLLKQNAAEIGITVEVKSVPWASFVDLAPSIFLYDAAAKRAYQDYLVWPAAEVHKKGEPFTATAGYDLYIRDFQYAS